MTSKMIAKKQLKEELEKDIRLIKDELRKTNYLFQDYINKRTVLKRKIAIKMELIKTLEDI